MAQQNDRYTKIYVAGLPWITRTECLRSYFEQFGEIVYANVVCDRATQRSKGFGFGTFKEVDSATRACENPNHMIDGRTTNCKLAYRGARFPITNQSNTVNRSLCTARITSGLTYVTLVSVLNVILISDMELHVLLACILVVNWV